MAAFKLTPSKYKKRFDSATKQSDETYTMFTVRLRCNLRYYVRSRACMDDFDGLFALLVAVKLKSCLSEGALDYVLALEERDCFGPRKIAELADTCVSNHGERDEPRCTVHVAQVRDSARDRSPRTNRWQGRTDRPHDGDREMQPARDVTCFLCNEKGPMVKFCSKKGLRSLIQVPSQLRQSRGLQMGSVGVMRAIRPGIWLGIAQIVLMNCMIPLIQRTRRLKSMFVLVMVI